MTFVAQNSYTNKVFPQKGIVRYLGRRFLNYPREQEQALPGMELHHISDSDLERYYIGAFRGIELSVLEEHLVWCTACAHRLYLVEESDQWVPRRMRNDAAASIELAMRILGGLHERPPMVTDEDRTALLALAQDDCERDLRIQLLATLVLDRARKSAQ